MKAAALGMTALIVLAGVPGPLPAQEPAGWPSLESFRSETWRWSSGVLVGILFAPGEVGRARNATGGHEQLIARWGDGLALGARLGLESRYGGFELLAAQSSSAVQVENEFGAAFPNHGGRPVAWTGSVLWYPLALLGRRAQPVKPFLGAGLGGVFLSVDLDNIRNQTLYHSFHWSLGGGLRFETSPEAVPTSTSTFVELRVARLRLWPNGPLRRFDALVATAGLGMRM